MDANTGKLYDADQLKALEESAIKKMDLVPLSDHEHTELKSMNRKERRARLAKMRKQQYLNARHRAGERQ